MVQIGNGDRIWSRNIGNRDIILFFMQNFKMMSNLAPGDCTRKQYLRGIRFEIMEFPIKI